MLILTTSGFCQNIKESIPALKSKSTTLDPALLDILTKEPPARMQDLIIYPGNSGSEFVLCSASPHKGTIVWHKGESSQKIQPPIADMLSGICYGQQALWAVCGTNATASVELKRYDLKAGRKAWDSVGSIDIEGGVPMLMVPLKKANRYLGIGARSLFEAGMKRGSYVGIFQQKEGKLLMDTCVDMPFDNLTNITKGNWYSIPATEPHEAATVKGETKPQRIWMGYADPAILTPTLNLPSVSDDFLVLGAASAGVLWVFDLEDGRLRHTINLTGLNRKQLAKISPLKQIILGTAFAPDGSLIVASVDPTLVKMLTALDLDEKDSQQKDWIKGDVDILINEIKGIHWRRIDPVHGFEEHLDSPVNFPEQMPSSERQEVFRFLIDPEGNVKTNAFTSWSNVVGGVLLQYQKKQESQKRIPTASSRISRP